LKNLEKNSISNLIWISVLGFSQFLSMLFFTKFFDYIYFSHFSLFIINLIQLISIWSNLWFEKLNAFRKYFFPLYLISLFLLSQSRPGFSIYLLVLCAAFALLFIQSEIIFLFNEQKSNLKIVYAYELIGGIVGVAFWYLLSVKIGFKGFLYLAILLTNLYYFKLNISKKSKIFNILISFLIFIFITEPLPNVGIIKQKNLNNNGEILDYKWDVSGRVELKKILNDDEHRVIEFERGPRTTIFHFDGNFKKLRDDYLKSIPTGLWGIDVYLAHYLYDGKQGRVLLISSVGGQEILAAKAFGAKEITAVDINASAQKMVTENCSEYSGNVYKNVNVVNSDGRFFVKNSKEIYNIIQLYSAHSTSFLSSLGTLFQPTTLITSEALRDYSAHLSTDGILQITMPKHLKLKSTFEKAFGHEELFKGRNIMALKKWGNREDLVTYLYKKNGWKLLEVDSILNLLDNDNKNKWSILINPFDSLAVQEQKANEYKEEFGPNHYSYYPSTDDWPFFKISKKIVHIFEYKLLLIVCAFIFILSILSLKIEKVQSHKSWIVFWILGFVFSFNQNLLILIFQKNLGLPALGLSVAIISMLLIGAIVALIQCRRLSNPVYLNLIFFTSVLMLLFLSKYSMELIFIPILLLTFFNGKVFAELMQKHSHYISKLFWYNGLGFLIGFFSFNIAFISMGLIHLIYFFIFILLAEFLILKKSL
jgi:hypothetical protein